MRREDIIIPYIRGKDVLDVGSLGHSRGFCLWDTLREHAATLTGIDLPEEARQVTELFGVSPHELPNDARIVRGNMETYQFGRQFDVVVAGDVLEHVENQGLFLRNVHRHLRPDGCLILTTPNARWPQYWVKTNPTHTLWHDRHTLSRILSLCGFRIVVLRGYSGNWARYGLLSRIVGWRRSLLAVCQVVESPPAAGGEARGDSRPERMA